MTILKKRGGFWDMSLADRRKENGKSRTRPNRKPSQKPTQDRKESKTNRSDQSTHKSNSSISKEKRFSRFSKFTKEERYILYESLIKLAQMRRKLWQNSRSKDVRDKVLTLLNLSSEMEKM